jgi:uncharacterized protein DUF4157
MRAMPARASRYQAAPVELSALRRGRTEPETFRSSLGNQAVQHLLLSGVVQAKLTGSQPGDPHEQEADRVADEVMRMPEPRAPAITTLAASSLQRKCAECEAGEGTCAECAEEEEAVQRKAVVAGPATAADASPIPRGGCHSLPPPFRSFFESRFGHDFGEVHVHTGAEADASARSIHALAYSHGSDIVFRSGQYSPGTEAGRRLLAHELTHVVQSRAAGRARRPQVPEKSVDDWRGQIAPPGATAERQANRIAQSMVEGLPCLESPVPATGILRAPDGEQGDQPPASPPAPPRRSSMAELLQLWHQAGLLDPPFRPSDVAPIPPLPVSAEEARRAGVPVAVSAAAPLLAPGTGLASSPATRPPLTVIQGGRGVPQPTPRVGRAPGPLRILGPIAVFLEVFLTPTSTAPPWMDTLSPITGGPYRSPEEYEWTRRLTRPQQDFLRRLTNARRLTPDPTVENDPAPHELPSPMPQPQPDPSRPEGCRAADIPRRGGHARHDAYATTVSGSPSDYLVMTLAALAIAYDGRTSRTSNVWEVKVGFGWFFNPDYRSLRDVTLARFDTQKNLGLLVAGACGYTHLWSIPDRWVAGLLAARWGGIPPVLSIPE